MFSAAWILHYLACICSASTLLIYNYVSLLHKEWILLLRSRWTKVKALYIIAQYVPFFFIATDLYCAFLPTVSTYPPDNELTCYASVTFAPNENLDKCRTCTSWQSAALSSHRFWSDITHLL
ncbi:hypothetical protein BDR03DRAFT_69453 [Suillus americanus]|nr:hypothetical protein BDR03DRAFT_69453 [Suillus americanus]